MSDEIAVLVIEDDPLVATVLDVTFRRDRMMTAQFCAGDDADDAVAMARRQQPDVIVVDFRLGGDLTGPQLVPLLQRAAPGSRTVLFTGVDERALEEANTSGIDVVLDKLQFQDLVPIVR